jgi:hypothetical protein
MNFLSRLFCLPIPTWSFIGFVLSLIVPAAAVFYKHLGIAGVVSYVLVASVIILVGSMLLRSFHMFASQQSIWLAAVMTFLALLITLIVIYPVVDKGLVINGKVVFGESDNDDALNKATSELLRGRYPYYPKTDLGNPISPLPGSLILAVPFVLAGHVAYQNLFWLVVFFAAMIYHLKDGRSALVLLWAIFVLSPTVVLYQFEVGNDYISNSLFVLLFTWLLINSVSQTNARDWKKLVSAILFGIGLSSRANFILIVPLVFSTLVQTAGHRSAFKWSAIALLTFVVVTIPFYLSDPSGFSPLWAFSKLGQFESIFPLSGIVIPLAASIVSFGLSFQRMDLTLLFRNCAIVQAIPVLCGAILSILQTGMIDVAFAYFSIFFLFFSVFSFWPDLFSNMIFSSSKTSRLQRTSI